MSMYKLRIKQENKKRLLSEEDTEGTSTSSSSSSTSTETSDDGSTTTTTTTETKEETSSQESEDNVDVDEGEEDLDTDMDEDIDGEDGTEDPSLDTDSSDGPVDNSEIPNSDKKIRLLKDYNELKQTSIFLLDSCIKIKELEETKSGKTNRVLEYMVTRMEDVVEKIKFIIVNKFISFDYTKLLTLYITLQANVYAIMNLLENVYGVDSNAKPEKDDK